ncbi:MAG: hypothetical protein H0U34_07770 [Sphingomonas sp.]|nr:hypothetical protein [Sphingomonas sp.]
MRLAFLVPAPDFAEEWRWAFDAEAAALVAGGAEVDAIPWTEAHQLTGYDLILPLVAWGYFERPGEWFDLLDRLEASDIPVINPPSVLRWSSDKAYLAELGALGVPTVPTIAVRSLAASDVDRARERFATQTIITKPPVSGGAFHTYRLMPGEPPPKSRLGLPAILQPFIQAIGTAGEYSLMLFDGVLSHSVLKRPRPGDFRVQPHLGGTSEPCNAPDGAEAIALAALAAAPGRATYARVDLIRDDDGELRIMELELVEPALFLDLAPDRGAAFTRSILRAAGGACKQPLPDR